MTKNSVIHGKCFHSLGRHNGSQEVQRENLQIHLAPGWGESCPGSVPGPGPGGVDCDCGAANFYFLFGAPSHITHHTSHHHNYVTCSGQQAAWLPRVTWSQDHILTHIWLKKYILKWDNVLWLLLNCTVSFISCLTLNSIRREESLDNHYSR